MIELTIGDLLNGNYDEPSCLYQLYVIRDSESNLVFYVGQSNWVTNRVLQHLGVAQCFPGVSSIGILLLKAMPESLAWKVQFYRQDEVLPEHMAIVVKGISREAWETSPITRYFPWREQDGQDHVVYGNLDEAEKILIENLRPCLNVTYNTHGQKLPPQYEELLWRDGTDAARAVRAVFGRSEEGK